MAKYAQNMLHNVNQKNFDALVLQHNQPVVVDVWADWCGPCKMLAPNFAAAAQTLEGQARFVKLDADKNQKLVKKYRVMSLPTVLIFQDGQEVARQSGVMQASTIVKQVNALIAASAGESGSAERPWWKFW